MQRVSDADAFNLSRLHRYRPEAPGWQPPAAPAPLLWLEGMTVAALMAPLMLGAMAVGVVAWGLQEGIRSSFSR